MWLYGYKTWYGIKALKTLKIYIKTVIKYFLKQKSYEGSKLQVVADSVTRT